MLEGEEVPLNSICVARLSCLALGAEFERRCASEANGGGGEEEEEDEEEEKEDEEEH